MGYMTIERLMGDCSQTGTVMALLNNNKRTRAVAYIIAWTDCSKEEAENAVNAMMDSSIFKSYVDSHIKREQFALFLNMYSCI